MNDTSPFEGKFNEGGWMANQNKPLNCGGGQKIIIVEKNLEPFREYGFISLITSKYSLSNFNQLTNYYLRKENFLSII